MIWRNNGSLEVMASLRNTRFIFNWLSSAYSPCAHLHSIQPQTCTPSSVSSPYLWLAITSFSSFCPLACVTRFCVFFMTPVQGLSPPLAILPWFSSFFTQQMCFQYLSSLYGTSLLMVLGHSLGCVCLGGKALSFFSKQVFITPFLEHHGVSLLCAACWWKPTPAKLHIGHHGWWKEISTSFQ